MVHVIPGCEAWSAVGGDVGALVLHGFTGNPSSVRPLGEDLAARGLSVELPRLPGHGTRWQELQRTRARDWVREASAALSRLTSRTRARVAVGLSGGALLSLLLAETRGDDLDGLVLVNPSVDYGAANPRLRLLPVLKWVVPSLPSIGNDIAKPGADELPYPRLPLKAVASGLQLERRVRERLGAVDVPTLVFTSRQDHTVDPRDSSRVLAAISSRDTEQVWLERSYHVATLDHDADLVAERTAAFIERVT